MDTSKFKKLKKADNGMYIDTRVLTQPNAANGNNATAQAQSVAGAAINQNSQQGFGDRINWPHVFGSQMILNGAEAFANHSANSYQNAILNYNKQQFSPLNYEAHTANNSTQALYGTPSFEGGGFSDMESDPDLEMVNYMFDDTPLDATKVEEPARRAPQTPYVAPTYDESGTLDAMSQFMSSSPRNNMFDASEAVHAPRGINLNGVHPDVMDAVTELQTRFPTLQVTSGIRSWGDKDAHPQGRAVDMSGPMVEEAYKYYKNTMVPKYGFNPALALNHGTGPHIHVGYYDDGGGVDGPGPRGDTPSYYGRKDMDLLMRNNQSVEYRQSAPGSIHTGSGFVTYLGDTLTNNQIPYAAHQAYEKYGISGDWRVSNSLRGPEDKQFIIQAANNAQYKLSPTDLKKIDAHTQGHQILYAHNDNLLPAPKYAEGGQPGPGPINRGDTPSYYGIHAPVMASNVRHTDYGNPASVSEQALQDAQGWIPIAQNLGKIKDQYTTMYNAVYNQGKLEKWSDKKLQSALTQATGPLQSQINALEAQMPSHYDHGGMIDELHSAIGDEMHGCPECVQEMMKKGGWIQKATVHMRKDHPCTGSKFGSSSCPPGSRRYNLAKTFRSMHHKHKKGGMTSLAQQYKNDGPMEVGGQVSAGVGGLQPIPGVMYSAGQVQDQLISNFKRKKNNQYKAGGTYELTQAEINDLKQLGYEFE